MQALFDYLPPAGLETLQVPIGARVRVPMGTRECVGVVVEHADESAVGHGALKPIHELIDSDSLIDRPLMRLLRWTAQYYHHPLGEVMAAALPKALRQGAPALPKVEFWRPSTAGLSPAANQTLRRSPRQQALLALLGAHPDGLPSAQIAAQLPSWREAARALEARGLLERCQETATAQAARPAAQPDEAPSLSAEQNAGGGRHRCRRRILRSLRPARCDRQRQERGVPAVRRPRARARPAARWCWCPRLRLTPQLVERFRRRLPCEMAVLHSGLSDAERLTAWRDARSGRARIVLGTRSAVFAPMPQLGLIVVDEEHDSSYKQHDSGCRYSARDLSVARAQQAQIPVVLGSATPAFETLHNLSGAATGGCHCRGASISPRHPGWP